jgi:hypothetical protein
MIANSIAGALSLDSVSTTSFESIATATGTGSSGTITFSSIPATYTHLQLRWIAQSNRATYADDDFNIRFNSDASSNYAWHTMWGNGASTFAGASASQTLITCRNGSGSTAISYTMGVGILDILDYANTNKYKTTRFLGGDDVNGTVAGYGGNAVLASGLWQSTSAISSISITNGSATNWTSLTSISLYGIKG